MSNPSPRRHTIRRLIPLVLLLATAVVFILAGGRRYLNFHHLADNHAFLCDLVARGGIFAVIGFILGYAALTALSIPVAMLMTLTAGFLFGPWLGGFYALVGATLGASVVFLAARAGLASLAEHAGPRLRRLQDGFREDALSYLFVLRLVPLFPFWLVNIVAGASGMTLPGYLVATFFGMVPGTLVYASLGNTIGELMAAGQPADPHTIARPSIWLPVIGLAVLALLPVAYKQWQARRREPVR